MKEVGLGWVLDNGEDLARQRGDDFSRSLPAQGLSDFAGSICHPHPLSPPLSLGTQRLEIKKLSFARIRQLWALGPGRRRPCLTGPVHSLPGSGDGKGLTIWLLSWAGQKKDTGPRLGSPSPRLRLEPCEARLVSRPHFLPLLSSCPQTRVPALAWAWAWAWADSAGKSVRKATQRRFHL